MPQFINFSIYKTTILASSSLNFDFVLDNFSWPSQCKNNIGISFFGHLNFLLKTGTERIALYYNTINSIGKKPSLACHYYCNLTNDVFEQRSKEYLNEIDNKINDIYDDFVEDEDTK